MECSTAESNQSGASTVHSMHAFGAARPSGTLRCNKVEPYV
jgi:hypothetical protein